MAAKKVFGSAEASNLVTELRRSFDDGVTRGYEWRVTQLKKLMIICDNHEPEIVAALRDDLGKPELESSVYEVSLLRNSIKLALKQLKNWMAPEKAKTSLTTFPASAEIVSEPLGVVLVISAWNYPFLLSIDPVIGAISAGNAVVLKPSELAPASSALLTKLLEQYLDPSAVRVVEGAVTETSALLEQKWDKIFYTGSSKIGRVIMAAAAKHLTPVVLELGGKSPVVVDSDTDLKVTVRRIIVGKWGCNNGQACVSPDYILTTKEYAPKLIDAMKLELEKFYGKNPIESYLPDRGGFSKPSSRSARQFSSGVVSASASSPSPSSSCSCGYSEILNFDFGSNRSWNQQGRRVQAMSSTAQRKFSLSKGDSDDKNEPDHLLVLVHGILASPSDWLYVEAELKRRLGRRFLIYASSSNTFTKTFGGIDGAGKRLAEEVRQVVQKSKSLKKISFLAHSLGGLFSRHAVAVLYSAAMAQVSDVAVSQSGNSNLLRGRIAGLEPINFITLATPHLGVRGRKQLPFLLGVPILEKLAAPIAPFFVGRTGSQLFLTDGKADKPPLLLRMASDGEDLKFLSALGAFRSRIIYANVSYDHMVGWRTSSIRRETELIKPSRRSLDGYKHVVDVEYCPPVSSDGAHFPPEAAKAKEAAQSSPSPQNTLEYHEIVEEEMIRGLQRLGWKKVDVSFHSTFWPYLAHNNIHVKSERLYKAGAGVIAHVADSIKQQESSTFITASL